MEDGEVLRKGEESPRSSPPLSPVVSTATPSSSAPTFFSSPASAPPDGKFSNNGEDPLGPAPSLFPVTSGVPQSSSGAPTLFPSFASAPPVFPVTETLGLQPTPVIERLLPNSSFSESLLPPPAATFLSNPSGPPLEHEERSQRRSSRGGQDGATASSSGGDDGELASSEVRRHKKKSHRKRRRDTEGRGGEKKHRKKELEQIDDRGRVGASSSVSLIGKRPGTTSSTAPKKEYYFDTRGDKESLTYGSLYRMDVSRYRRSEIRGTTFDEGFFVYFDGEGVGQDEKLRTGGRYWSLKFSSLQRKRKLKQLRIGSRKPERNVVHSKSAPLPQFVPLDTVWWVPGEDGRDLDEGKREEGETWLEYVAHKTKELNRLSRERPHDESVWIRFANFQDELIQATGNRAAIQNLIAKKIAIFEKALDLHHRDSEELLILYLETCKRSDDAATLLRKWERAVHSHSGSLRMWREFLRFRRSQFSTFSVSAIRSLYSHALQALTAARNKLSSKAIGEGNQYKDFVEAEQALVSIFLDLCRFNWQAGHHELAIGLFQAQIEYCLFSPRLLLTESGKLTLFESFWSSGSPRFGEEGAVGWSTSLEEDQKARESKLLSEAQMEEEDAGGWTGWSAPSKELEAANGSGQPLDEEAWSMEDDAQVDEDVAQEEEDEAALLEKLGLSFSSTKDVEVQDTRIWKRWAEKEVERDQEQWLPGNNHQPMSEEDDQLESMVLFDDIKDSLFTLNSNQAQLSLIHQFVDFCGGPLPQWCSSNSDSFLSELNSLVSLNRTMMAEMDSVKWPDEQVGDNILTKLVGGPSWYEKSPARAKFLQNCLVSLKSVFPQDRFLSDAMLRTEDPGTQEAGSQKSSSRALAKKLLKKNRKDVLMWGAYACIEGAAGNIATARTVFDTTLASLGDPSGESARDAPILCLAYAEMELAQGSNEPSLSPEQRALHILCCVGSGSVYAPPSREGLAATTLLKSHRGFREHLQQVRRTERVSLTERGAALIACAAIFEQLTNGWEAGTAVFEEGLAMWLPETKQHSLQCELLFLRYIRMLENSKSGLKPARFRSTLLQGLGQYPQSSKLMGAYMNNAFRSARSFDLRRYFDDASGEHSSPSLWLFALSCEMWRGKAEPRIHRLFERGLESRETQHCVLLWRCYLAYEVRVAANAEAARRVYFRAIHACPWAKTLWVDGFLMLGSILSAKELSEFVDVMRDKELRLRTDMYEILLEDEA